MDKEKTLNLLSQIKVTPLAAESFGVRSMCTLVETADITVLLDAGISVCPYRFNLPPHPLEFQTIARLRKVIASAADRAQVTTISHYHFDHHTPSFEDWVVNWTETCETARQIYQGKKVLVKNPKETSMPASVNAHSCFRKQVVNKPKFLEAADGKTFNFGGVYFVFLKQCSMVPILCWVGWLWLLLNAETSGSCLRLILKDRCQIIRWS